MTSTFATNSHTLFGKYNPNFLRRYFKASDLVTWATKSASMSEAEAVRFGQQLKEKGYLFKRHDENLKSSATAFVNDTTSWRFSVRCIVALHLVLIYDLGGSGQLFAEH